MRRFEARGAVGCTGRAAVSHDPDHETADDLDHRSQRHGDLEFGRQHHDGEGHRGKHPQTDQEWSTYRNAAAMLIESGNLLMLDGRAVDNDQWMVTSRGMADAAATVLEAAEAK